MPLVTPAPGRPYYHAPDLGLEGRWSVALRLSGLATTIAASRGQRVLDLGCAEGLVARAFMQAGARVVHGFELDPERVRAAEAALRTYPAAAFRQADLSDWAAFRNRHEDHLFNSYDLVLYLGLHHHLPAETRTATLLGAAGISAGLLATRMPDAVYLADQVGEHLERASFTLLAEHRPDPRHDMGTLRLFRRCSGSRDDLAGNG